MSFTLTIDFKIAGIKLESSEAYLLKLEKNAVLNACGCLKGFYTYKKINNKFLKFDYSLLRMPKITEIG